MNFKEISNKRFDSKSTRYYFFKISSNVAYHSYDFEWEFAIGSFKKETKCLHAKVLFEICFQSVFLKF